MTTSSTQWPKELRYLMVGVGLVLFGLFIKFMGPVLPTLVIGAMLAYLLSPLVGWLHNRLGWNRTRSVVLVYTVSLILIFVALPSIGVPILIEQWSELQDELIVIIGELEKSFQFIADLELPFDLELIPEIPYDLISEQLNPDRFFNIIGHATKNLLYFLLVMFSWFFFLHDWPKLKKWFLGLWPASHAEESQSLMTEVTEVWNAYLRGTLLMSFMVGTTTWLSLIVMGVPSPLALAFLAAIGDMLPKLGPLTVMIVVSLVALFGGSTLYGMTNFWFFVLVLIVTGIIQTVATFIVRPRILGGRMHLHPGVVIVAIISALTLSGVVLALIVVPLTATSQIVMRYMWGKIMDEPVEMDQSVDPLVE